MGRVVGFAHSIVLTLYLCIPVAACQLYPYGTAYEDTGADGAEGHRGTQRSELSARFGDVVLHRLLPHRIVGYFCVPTVAGWIIEAGGGIGSYGRNVNQTAQRGAQGAYTGSKYLAGGAGAVAGNAIGRIKGALLKGK